MSEQDERERIRRIRDAQINARAPLTRDRKQLQRRAAQVRRGKVYTWEDVLLDIKARWTWMLGGAVAGYVASLIILSVVKAPGAAVWIQLITILFGVAIGRTIGVLIDRGRDEGWRY